MRSARARRSASNASARGTNDGDVCASDDQCANGECGAALFEFRDRFLNDTGPVVVSQTDGVVRAVMRAPPDPAYGLTVGEPAPLGGLFQTATLSAFVIDESLELHDLNGDGDTTDRVVTLQNRVTGTPVPIGDNGAWRGCVEG
jgi:hypothetical protein